MLEVKGLYKRYGRFTALDHIDLSLETGSIFGFVGPNGAGKTTAMKILATLMPPTGGEAFIDGVSVVENPREIRGMIGYMPDFFGVYDDLKVVEYLDFYGSAAGLSYRERKKAGEDLLELVYLSDKRDSYVDTLSRGMKQRLCLARSLIGDPKLLILDEPASGMDPRARIEMKSILKALKDMNKTILISSHILPELAELCDVFGVIEKGKFRFVGTIEEISRKIHGGEILALELTEPSGELVTFLYQRPELHNVRAEETRVFAGFSGGRDGARALLRELVAQGFPLVGFRLEQENLENVFLEVTRSEED